MSVRVSLVQMDVRQGDVDRNLARAQSLLERAVGYGSHVVLLPEMWSTGFAYDDFPALAEASRAAALDVMRRAARQGRCYVAGSIPEPADSGLFNTLYLIQPDGAIGGTYRKVHLFPPMAEDRSLTPGDGLGVFDTRLGRVGGLICYDLRFPELSRALAAAGARLFLVPAQWPHPRQAHWEVLLRARAIENQVFIAAANRVGVTGETEFFGHSYVIDPWGRIVDGAEDREAVVTVSIDLDQVDAVRAALPAWSRRRPELYAAWFREFDPITEG